MNLRRAAALVLIALAMVPATPDVQRAGGDGGVPGDGVETARDAELSQRSDADADLVIATLPGCTASLERRRTMPLVVHLRNECDRPVADKAALLARMLALLVPAPAGRGEIRTLFVGRLVIVFPELSQRIAIAAARSGFDVARAAREPGYANVSVRRIADAAGIHAELETALASLGYRVRLSTVEKVLIGRPAETPIAGALAAGGIAPHARVPFDALTWFRLEPVAAPSEPYRR